MLYMKFIEEIKKFSSLELTLLIIFILYLIFPLETPEYLKNIVNSPIGMIVIFIITILLFIHTNPVLAILYLFVAYELLRRSSNTSRQYKGSNKQNNTYSNIPSLNENDLKNREDNSKFIEQSSDITLEEDIINKMSPIGKSDPIEYVQTTFKPFAEKINGASLF